MTALLIYPTHQNCREVEAEYLKAGIEAATYPGRAIEASESFQQNCWNEDAGRAEATGLPVLKTVCPGCPHRSKCESEGYLGQLKRVDRATVALCTHKRAQHSGLPALTDGREYVSIHENPIDVLRPPIEISELDLIQVQHVIKRIVTDPTFLDWFSPAMRIDNNGSRYHDEELAIRRNRQHRFCLHLERIIDALVDELKRTTITTEWQPKATMKPPTGVERTLFLATRVSKSTFQGQPWRFVLAGAAGEFCTAAILVERRYVKGAGQGKSFLIKFVCGFLENRPGASSTTWINDATVNADRLTMVIKRPVHDLTPQGRIGMQRKAVQIPRDITRGSSKEVFGNLLRGVLADRPQFRRIGVICHRPHVESAKTLGIEFDSRITKVTHFGSGEDRSSNDWHLRCDLIIVAGTPRIPPGAIVAYLVQVGEVEAARRDPRWGTVYWLAETESGAPFRVKTRGYLDEAWRRAHQDLVRAHLIQAIGRGRGILASGCEVVVLSTEECGLVISDIGLKPLNRATTKVLEVMRELRAQNPNEHSLEFCALKSAEIAANSGLGHRRTQVILADLERRALIRKVGHRQGWLPVPEAAMDAATCPG